MKFQEKNQWLILRIGNAICFQCIYFYFTGCKLKMPAIMIPKTVKATKTLARLFQSFLSIPKCPEISNK